MTVLPAVRSISFKKLYRVRQVSFIIYFVCVCVCVCVCGVCDDWLAAVAQTQQNVREHLNPPRWDKKDSFVCSLRPGNRSPPFKTLIQPLWTLGNIPMTTLSPARVRVVCDHACMLWRCNSTFSIQFDSVYLCSAFYSTIVTRCFTEAETQSQNLRLSTVARKSSLLTGRNLEQDPPYKEEPSC